MCQDDVEAVEAAQTAQHAGETPLVLQSLQLHTADSTSTRRLSVLGVRLTCGEAQQEQKNRHHHGQPHPPDHPTFPFHWILFSIRR